MIALLALASSITGIANGFAVDDRSVIEMNDRVHSLAGWWRLFGESYWPTSAQAGLYRPVTMLAFALQWTAGRGAPIIFHAVSIALYVCTSVAVYRLCRHLIGEMPARIAAAVFAVHPVHVEAVGNVVGQSELIATLAVLGAVLLYLRVVERSNATAATAAPPDATRILAIAGLYLIGILTKESAIVLPALLVLIHVYLFANVPSVSRPRWTGQWRAFRLTYLALVAVTLVALWARSAVLGDTTVAPNTALEGLTLTQRVATMLGVAPEWLRLFVWPARLIPVYSPPYIHIAHSFDATAATGLVLLLATIVFAWATARSTTTRAIAFGIAWIAVSLAPVSNILFATGIVIAERTLFLPTVGFAIAVGCAAGWLADRPRAKSFLPSLQFAGALLIVLALARSAIHQRVWSDDGHLITAAIQAAPNSYMLDEMYGEYAERTGQPAVAEQWFKRATQLYPSDPSTHISLGELYVQAGRYDAALLSFTVALRLDHDNADARAGSILALDRLGRFDEARRVARLGIAAGGSEGDSFRRLYLQTDILQQAASR
jgi:hypothetical protein